MSGSIDNSASQVASLIDSDGGNTHVGDYSYLELGSVVEHSTIFCSRWPTSPAATTPTQVTFIPGRNVGV